LTEESIPNVFRLSEALPDGDWIMTARIVPEFQTGHEEFSLGLHEAKDDYLVARLVIVPDPYYGHKFFVRATKMAGTQETAFDQLILRYYCNVCGENQSIQKFVSEVSKPILLRLTKQGRSYDASAQWEGSDENGEPYPLLRTEKVTSLRSNGLPFIAATQNQDSKGESLFQVDWMKIEVP
jgi:hypothetical protein